MRWRIFPQLLVALSIIATASALDREPRWTAHHDPAEGKPYFHPVALPNGEVFTDLRPADHPWHRGLWWSWKYINGVNFWEEDRKTGRSQGRTELVSHTDSITPNGGTHIAQSLIYRGTNDAVWLDESRTVDVTVPADDGSYMITWCSRFSAHIDQTLDRTPPSAAWGGYAGLALRLGAAQKKWTYESSEPGRAGDSNNGQPARWVQARGPNGGFVFMDHPSNPRYPTPWRVTPGMPFVSPSPLYASALKLKAGECIAFRYRLWIHGPSADRAAAEAAYQSFTGE